jgi:hypothetical protein
MNSTQDRAETAEQTTYTINGIDNVVVGAIPQSLKDRPQWVAWKSIPKPGGKPTKVPVNPYTGGNAKSNDPTTWSSFDESVRRATTDNLAGIGLMFTGDNLVGVDLDNVWDGDRWSNPLAESVAYSLDTYTEVSPSGRGVKMWLLSGVHPQRCTGTVRHGEDAVEYETYHEKRWFAVTGHVLPQYGGGLVQERSAKYAKMLEMGHTPRQAKPAANMSGALPAVPPMADSEVQRDEDLVRGALRWWNSENENRWFRAGCCLKSWGAKTGVGDQRARALWDAWSQTSLSKYDQAGQDDSWDRMAPDGGLSIGTIFAEAEEDGWNFGDAVGRDGREYTVNNSPEWIKHLDAWHAECMAEMKSLGVKPVIELPNIGGWSRTTITDASDKIGELMGNSKSVYCRGGVVVKIKDGESVEVSPAEMQSELERHATLVIAKTSPKGEVRTVATTATASQCQAVMASHAYLANIPLIKTMTRCPVITGRKQGGLAVVSGYDRESGILATGGTVETVSLEDAVPLLMGCLADFEFSSRGDRSRAIASLMTPALVQGGLLNGRSPIDLGEADDSQAGKGYRNRMVAAVYNAEVNTIAQRQGGSGSLEESFCRALMAGTSFLSIDNVRRKIDSPLIESALTEDYCDCRVPYRQPMQIDMRRVCVMMTTNGVELNRDLANRCSPVRIRKRQPGYTYRKYPEGDLIAHVKANQGLFLGAVFAVVKAWHEAGMPATSETRHDFRRWAGVLDWIVQNVFKAAPLCDGLIESKARMTNPHLSWLRELAIAVLRKGMGGRPLRAGSLVDVAEEAGIELGGDPSTASDPDKAANQMMGRKLGRAFSLSTDGRTLNVDDTLTVERQSETDSEGRERKLYLFKQGERTPEINPEIEPKNGVPPIEGASTGSLGGNVVIEDQGASGWGSDFTTDATKSVFPPNEPPNPPLINPLIKPNIPLYPLMLDNIFSTMAIFQPPKDGGDTHFVVMGEKNALISGLGGIRGKLNGEIDGEFAPETVPEIDPDWEAKFNAIGESEEPSGVVTVVDDGRDPVAEANAMLGVTF